MDKKNNGGIGGQTLCIIVQKIGDTIFIMIRRKARVSRIRGLHVLPLFSPFKGKAYDGSGITPR
jgi:hypothetical protein